MQQLDKIDNIQNLEDAIVNMHNLFEISGNEAYIVERGMGLPSIFLYTGVIVPKKLFHEKGLEYNSINVEKILSQLFDPFIVKQNVTYPSVIEVKSFSFPKGFNISIPYSGGHHTGQDYSALSVFLNLKKECTFEAERALLPYSDAKKKLEADWFILD